MTKLKSIQIEGIVEKFSLLEQFGIKKNYINKEDQDKIYLFAEV